MTMRVRKFSVLAVTLLAGVCSVPAARAGEWTQVSCTQPDGQPAPTEGWSAEAVSGPGDYSSAYNTCDQPSGALVAETSDEWPQSRYSGWLWHYATPSGSKIAGGTLSLGLYAPQGQAYAATPNNSYDGADIVMNCQFNLACSSNGIDGGPFSGTVAIYHLGGTSIYAEAECLGPSSSTEGCTVGHGGNGVNAQTTIYAADIELTNESSPTGTGFSGTLLEAGTGGTAELTFTAQDPGGPGVYQVTATVDGTQAYQGTPDSNGGRCASIGKDASGVREFLYAQPCKQTVTVDVPINTTSLSSGQHHLVVSVTDAAGNSAVVLDREITVANGAAGSSVAATGAIGPGSPAALRGPLNGTNASDQAKLTAGWIKTKKAALTSRYGVRDQITGRLTTSAGQPISGASLDVYTIPAYQGARTQTLDNVRTGGTTGQWTLTLPADVSSSSMRFAYRSHLDDTVPVVTATLALRVHAGIALRITPRITSVGRSIFFSGVLHGTPIPPGGKQLVLEASSGGEWVQFDTISTNTKGRYRASYRFKFPGPVTYRFRVVSPYEADFPFLNGASNSVAVHEL
jgi:hypothetical protein